MRIIANFPKDKEEMQKRRLQAMLLKIGRENTAGVDFSGQDGEKRLEEINQELTRWYKENKD